MKRMIWLSTVVVTVLIAPRPGPVRAAGAELAVFDAPRGTWLATVRANAALVVLEERQGWRRVRIEGWVAGPVRDDAPALTPAATETSPPSAPQPSQAVGPGAVVRGVLLPPATGHDERRGAGLVVLLVSELPQLESEHAEAGARCRADIAAADLRLESLRADRDRALNSTGNFREATGRLDHARAAIDAAEATRSERVGACRSAAVAIYNRHAVARTISDDAGRFEFTGVTPGEYRVVATEAGSGTRAWSLDCAVGAGTVVVLDPLANASRVDPFWGVR